MQPGEIYRRGPDNNSIYLRKNGNVEIRGTLFINGTLYKPCECGGVSV